MSMESRLLMLQTHPRYSVGFGIALSLVERNIRCWYQKQKKKVQALLEWVTLLVSVFARVNLRALSSNSHSASALSHSASAQPQRPPWRVKVRVPHAVPKPKVIRVNLRSLDDAWVCGLEGFFSFFFKQNILTGVSQARLLCPWNSPGKNTEVSCCCSVTQSCPILCNPMDCRTPGFPFTVSWSLLKLMSIELMMPFDHLLLCCSLLLLPSIFPRIRVLPHELALCIRWPKYWSFSISPSSEPQGSFPLALTGLISLLSKGLLRVFSHTTVQKHQFFGAQPSLWFNCYIHTWLLKKP